MRGSRVAAGVILVLALAPALASAQAPTQSKQKSEAMYREGIELAKANKIEAALALFEEARAAGLSTMQSKRDCSFANVITRALGIAERAEPDVCTVETQPGDLLLLCSDGLSDPLSEPRIAELLKAARAPGDQALAIATEGLVQAAYDAGGRDNISAIVVQVL